MIIIINFKTHVTGKEATKLARLFEKIARANKAAVVLAVKTNDLGKISSLVNIPVIAQQVDNFSRIKKGIGSLINHSDHPLTLLEIKRAIAQLRKNRLISIACAPNSTIVKKIARLKPDLIAIEPPELIGGNKSVSTTKPGEVRKAVQAANGIPLLCGAGIKTRADVIAARKLGVQGILISSGVVKAKNPGKALAELLH
ncbi:triose-phosphate isomerase [Candidatus Woesearchaeota archaeon]|nr:triose-phosphate isomerase [Candidatus Woesearchaeota archaeon]